MGKRRNRIAYAPKSRRKSSVSDRNQSASSSAQGTEEKLETKKPKRTSRIVYDPKSPRRSSSSSDNAKVTSSNVQEINEKSERNKRHADDSASFSLNPSHQQQPKV